MTGACSICTHASRPAIDAALSSGMAMRTIAGRFSVSRSAVDRHRVHVMQMLSVASIIRHETNVGRAADILTQTASIEATVLKLFSAALERGDEVAAAIWFDRVLKATAFRFTVEVARPPLKQDNVVIMRMKKQVKMQEVALRMMEILEQQKEAREAAAAATLTIDHHDDDDSTPTAADEVNIRRRRRPARVRTSS